MKLPMHKALAFITLILVALLLPTLSQADANDYDPITGEPKCMNCHTPDRKYSIDYTRQESCAMCHSTGLSDRYIAIDSRYKNSTDNDNGVGNWVVAKADINNKGHKDSSHLTTPPKERQTGPFSHKDMAFIKAGEFTMGSNDWWPKSQPEHLKYVGDFYIDKYEVTNARYMAFVLATQHARPKHWIDGSIPRGKEDHPVTYVNWFDADSFCRWENKRLPTEPEWEKAARGTDKRTFPWGDKFAKEKANTPQYGHGDTMAVASFSAGKSPYGLYDMAGNAFEWLNDWFKPYPGNKHPDENYGEYYKIVRGGSWYDCTYYKCGISAPTYNRIFFNPYTKNNNFGFRCAGNTQGG